MASKKKNKYARQQNIATPFGSRTDVGCVRERNEDSLIVSPPLFAVADGMGGHAAGDVASEVAIRALIQNAPTSTDVEALGNAVQIANQAVIDEAQRTGLDGMGTTMTAAILEKEHLVIAHVGDSRAYLLHHGKLQQITRDHSLMADMIEAGRLTPEEARLHPNRSIITRALGSDPTMQPDLYELTASPGDRLLLCSDGLSAMVEESIIQEQLSRVRDPQRCASSLVNSAIAAGGLDNVTVIVVDITGHDIKATNKIKRRSRAWVVVLIMLLAAIVAAAAGSIYTYAQNSAYLKAENGMVVVYRGIPGSVFGVSISALDHVTDIPVSSLQPGTQSHLEGEGIRTDSLADANELVQEYRNEISNQGPLSGRGAVTSASVSTNASSSTTNESSTSKEGGGA